MRGLRAPGRLEAVDPAVLRERADAMERPAILGQYARATSPEDLVEVYRPLVTEIGADYVSIQVASTDPEGTIKLIGDQVLPALRELSGA
jgi:coenzyme F420-dependent glucose-6-phosphate dehydrogenase